MSLTDWEIYKANAGMIVAVETSTPIAGSGSFKINHGGTGGSGGIYANLRRATTPRGFTSGRARLCIKHTTQYITTTFAGFVFQQSQADLTASGTAYFAGVQWSNNDTLHRLNVWRLTAGLTARTLVF